MKDELGLMIHFIVNTFNKKDKKVYSIFPVMMIVKCSGFYSDNINKIQKVLNNPPIILIMQLLTALDETNALQLQHFTGYSYPLIHRYIRKLNILHIIDLKPGKSLKKKKEITVKLNKNIIMYLFSESKDIVFQAMEDEIKEAKEAENIFADKLGNLLKRNFKESFKKMRERISKEDSKVCRRDLPKEKL